MENLVDYLKSMNPKKDEQAILFYGRKYKLFREGEFVGIATWTKDENVGDSFQRPSKKVEGAINVLVADKWELIIKSKK